MVDICVRGSGFVLFSILILIWRLMGRLRVYSGRFDQTCGNVGDAVTHFMPVFAAVYVE